MMNFTQLEERIAQMMPCNGSRGMAVGILAGGDVLYHNCFGVRNADGDAVTCDTVFPIASITKTFTGALAARLVHKGLVSWDTRMMDILPNFGMSDGLAAQIVTIEDALGHRSGLARNEYAWMHSGFDLNTVVSNIRHLPMYAPIRTVYHYTNIMFAAFCVAVESLTGERWQDVMKREITDPAGMQAVTFSVTDTVKHYDNHAVPFEKAQDGMIDLPLMNIDNVAGAGCINTTLNDMMKWLAFACSYGTVNGSEVLERESFEEMITGRIPAFNSKFWRVPEFQHKSYAIGWQSDIFRGRRLIRHTGGIDGFFTSLMALPDEGLGVVTLNNTCGAPVEELINLQILDELLGFSPLYWQQVEERSRQQMEQAQAQGRGMLEATRIADAPPSLPLQEYPGEYRHAGYPSLAVSQRQDRLFMTFSGMNLPLIPWHFDTFMLPFSESILAPVTFRLDETGRVTALSMPIDEEMHNVLTFVRQ